MKLKYFVLNLRIVLESRIFTTYNKQLYNTLPWDGELKEKNLIVVVVKKFGYDSLLKGTLRYVLADVPNIHEWKGSWYIRVRD